jgi:hypothetical protein
MGHSDVSRETRTLIEKRERRLTQVEELQRTIATGRAGREAAQQQAVEWVALGIQPPFLGEHAGRPPAWWERLTDLVRSPLEEHLWKAQDREGAPMSERSLLLLEEAARRHDEERRRLDEALLARPDCPAAVVASIKRSRSVRVRWTATGSRRPGTAQAARPRQSRSEPAKEPQEQRAAPLPRREG